MTELISQETITLKSEFGPLLKSCVCVASADFKDLGF